MDSNQASGSGQQQQQVDPDILSCVQEHSASVATVMEGWVRVTGATAGATGGEALVGDVLPDALLTVLQVIKGALAPAALREGVGRRA